MKIKVISRRKGSVLVEFRKGGKPQRVYIPPTDIKDGEVSEYKLKLGIPYGIEWAKYITLQVTSQDLEDNLRNAGIWTSEDALQNPQILLGVLQKTYQIDLGAIQRIAKEADNG